MADQIRTKGGVLLGALVSGALVAGTLTGAPTANATCASFWGINNGGGCTSTLFSAAIAIGTGATATASGMFGTAFAVGTNASATTQDLFDFATALGTHATAGADGIFGSATQLGTGRAFTGGAESGGKGLGFNIAVNFTPTTVSNGPLVEAYGVGNLAVNLFGTGGGSINTLGYGNVAVNIGGAGNEVGALALNDSGYIFSPFNIAFNLLGSHNQVRAGDGPLAIAGSVGQNTATVLKVGPGININNAIHIGGAAAVKPKTATPTATAVRTRTHKPAPAATATSHSKK